MPMSIRPIDAVVNVVTGPGLPVQPLRRAVSALAEKYGFAADSGQRDALCELAAGLVAAAKFGAPPSHRAGAAALLDFDSRPSDWQVDYRTIAARINNALGPDPCSHPPPDLRRPGALMAEELIMLTARHCEDYFPVLERDRHPAALLDAHLPLRDWPRQAAVLALSTCRLAGARLSARTAGDELLLTGVSFRAMDLSYADLSGMRLPGSDLTHAMLERTTLAGAHLRGAKLTRAIIHDADFTGADLSDATLEGARGYRVNLSRAVLRGTELSKADLLGADATDATFCHAKLNYCRLRELRANGADLQHAQLRGSQLGSAALAAANLSGANLRATDLYHADLTGANLTGANLESATFKCANFTRANLTNAVLENVGMSKADFTGANLEGTRISLNPTTLSLLGHRSHRDYHINHLTSSPGGFLDDPCGPGILGKSLLTTIDSIDDRFAAVKIGLMESLMIEMALVREIGDSLPSLADVLLKGNVYRQSDALRNFIETRLHP